MINPLDDSWQQGLKDLTGQDLPMLLTTALNLIGQDPTYGIYADGPNGQDLGYAGSWNTAVSLIYRQTR